MKTREGASVAALCASATSHFQLQFPECGPVFVTIVEGELHCSFRGEHGFEQTLQLPVNNLHAIDELLSQFAKLELCLLALTGRAIHGRSFARFATPQAAGQNVIPLALTPVPQTARQMLEGGLETLAARLQEAVTLVVDMRLSGEIGTEALGGIAARMERIGAEALVVAQKHLT